MAPTGCQASPSRAARLMAGLLCPPIQMGGYGFCTGLGRKVMSEKLTYLPSNLGSSLVQSSMKAWRYSSVTAPRSAKGGASRSSNSSSIQPTPAPRINRPLDSMSRVASILAVRMGLR